jgi:hypothetical protein
MAPPDGGQGNDDLYRAVCDIAEIFSSTCFCVYAWHGGLTLSNNDKFHVFRSGQ